MVGYSKARSESIHPQTVKHLCQVSLDDKCERGDNELYLTGTQAHVKFAMLQEICNRQAEMLDSGHNPMSRVAVV